MKTCIKCLEKKPMDQFYPHWKMGDGRLNKCKSCCCAYARQRRIEHPEIVKQIDRKKSMKPSRRQWVVEHQKIVRLKNPEKYKARTAVQYALRSGKLVKQNCVVCGSTNTEAHHHDYSQPLNVVWVCFQHHRQIHGQLTQTF